MIPLEESNKVVGIGGVKSKKFVRDVRRSSKRTGLGTENGVEVPANDVVKHVEKDREVVESEEEDASADEDMDDIETREGNDHDENEENVNLDYGTRTKPLNITCLGILTIIFYTVDTDSSRPTSPVSSISRPTSPAGNGSPTMKTKKKKGSLKITVSSDR